MVFAVATVFLSCSPLFLGLQHPHKPPVVPFPLPMPANPAGDMIGLLPLPVRGVHAQDSPFVAANAPIAAGMHSVGQKDYESVEKNFKQAAGIYEKGGWPEAQAGALMHVAAAQYLLGKTAEAQKTSTKYLGLLSTAQCSEPYVMLQAHMQAASRSFLTGQYEDALGYTQSAMVWESTLAQKYGHQSPITDMALQELSCLQKLGRSQDLRTTIEALDRQLRPIVSELLASYERLKSGAPPTGQRPPYVSSDQLTRLSEILQAAGDSALAIEYAQLAKKLAASKPRRIPPSGPAKVPSVPSSRP